MSEHPLPLGKQFSLLTNYYIGIVTKKLAEVGIERYYYVVYVLGEAEAPMCQKDLAEAVSMDNVSMVRVVDYLSEKGFLKRERDEKDRRYYRLLLTAKATAAFKKIKDAFAEADNKCLKGFAPEEKRQFHRLLLKAQHNLLSEPRNLVNLRYKKIK